MVVEMRKVGDRIKQLEKEIAVHDGIITTVLMGVPNTPHESVPVGKNETDNILVKTHGTPPEFDF